MPVADIKPSKIWDDFDLLNHCEKLRVRHKKRIGRLTYDCVNTVVTGDRVKCKAKRILDKLSADGSMKLLGVLKGRTSTFCLECTKYEEG